MTIDRERIERLTAVPLFARLDPGAIEKVLQCANEFEVSHDHVLAQPHQPGAGLFVIEEGTVVVDLPTGPVELGPGEFVGELSILDERAVHSARVRTKTQVRGLAIARDDFMRLLEEDPKIAVAALKVVARRLATLIERH